MAGATVPLLFAIEWKKYKSKYWKNEISLSFDEFYNFPDMNGLTNGVIISKYQWKGASKNDVIYDKHSYQIFHDISW